MDIKNKCIFDGILKNCKCGGKLQKLTDANKTKIIQSSYARKDDKFSASFEYDSEYECHNNCLKTYTSGPLMAIYALLM